MNSTTSRRIWFRLFQAGSIVLAILGTSSHDTVLAEISSEISGNLCIPVGTLRQSQLIIIPAVQFVYSSDTSGGWQVRLDYASPKPRPATGIADMTRWGVWFERWAAIGIGSVDLILSGGMGWSYQDYRILGDRTLRGGLGFGGKIEYPMERWGYRPLTFHVGFQVWNLPGTGFTDDGVLLGFSHKLFGGLR